MNLKEISWKVIAILHVAIWLILSIVISPIIGVYCLIEDYFVNRMEFSLKDILMGFMIIPTIMSALLYAVCTRNREQVLEITRNPDVAGELFSKFGL